DNIHFSIGDTWTFERANDRLNMTFFQEISVIDTITREGLSCYVIDRGLLSGQDTMCVSGERVYFWDERLGALQLQYDYGSDSTFIAEYISNNGIETYEVFVDSIKLETIDSGIEIPVHYFRSSFGYSGPEFTIRSYRGIGQDRHHPRYANGGLIIDDFEESNRELRCFSNDSLLYRLVDYPCDTTFSNPEPLDLDNSFFSIGDTWIYEEIEIPNPVRFRFYEINIIDITVWNGREVFVLEPGLETDFDYIHERNGEIFFWDFDINAYQKYYDFNAEVGDRYTISFIDKGPVGTGSDFRECTVTVDSIETLMDENMVEFQVQYLSFDCTNNRQFNTEIYNNIGHTYQHPRLQLWESIADSKILPNGIRCFENDSLNYQFKPYACDTMFSRIILSTEEASSDVISIYPNPNNGYFSIDGLGVGFRYDIYTYSGERINSGIYSSKGIEVTRPGLYIITGLYNERRWYKKLVVLR
ncbi:T9SS type A sorting domain-containing protein, partial [Saprospiraceae bacterium]|nr:T9SS type A sorting domain-containing protein [Saprospiraceae bacterium]